MYWLLLLFLIILVVLSQQREHLATNQLMGPTVASLFDPTYKPKKCKRKRSGHSEITLGPSYHEPPPEDEGTHRSDTATRQYSIYSINHLLRYHFPRLRPHNHI